MKILYILKKKSIKQVKDCIGEFVAIDSVLLKIEFSFSILNDSGIKLVFPDSVEGKKSEINILKSDYIISPLNIIFSGEYEEISSHVSTILPNLIKKYLEDKKAQNAQS